MTFRLSRMSAGDGSMGKSLARTFRLFPKAWPLRELGLLVSPERSPWAADGNY